MTMVEGGNVVKQMIFDSRRCYLYRGEKAGGARRMQGGSCLGRYPLSFRGE
jgi:hypothetical protein